LQRKSHGEKAGKTDAGNEEIGHFKQESEADGFMYNTKASIFQRITKDAKSAKRHIPRKQLKPDQMS